MATHSILFAIIAVFQVVNFVLLGLSNSPSLVEFHWQMFAFLDPALAVVMRDSDSKLHYGLWQYCEDGELDECKYIEDGDLVISEDGQMRQLNTARVLLLCSIFFCFLSFISCVLNTIKRKELVTTLHLSLTFMQFLCAGASAALATHVLKIGDWVGVDLGWTLIVFWVGVGMSAFVLFISFLTPCMTFTYSDGNEVPEDKEYSMKKAERSNVYVMSQPF